MRKTACLGILGGWALLMACAEGESSSSGGGGAGGGLGATAGTGGTVWGGGSGGGPTGGGGGPTGGSGGFGATGGSGGGGTGGVAGAGATGGVAGGGGAAGGGGTAGATDASTDAGWPTCDTQPSGVPTKTVQQIWADNPSTETQVWVPGVYVTAVSGAGCTAGQSCQIFVQQDETYATLALGAKNAIKLRIAGSVADKFAGIVPGDRVDVLGHAWRYNLPGSNEMVIQIHSTLPGCVKKIGTGSPAPITGVQLSDLTVLAYEQTHGPLLVQVATVTGKPAAPTEIFGIWATGVGIGDAGPEGMVNVSPYFLAGGAFSGLPTNGQTAVDFLTVTGVFAVYVPLVDGGTAPKYVVLYPRTMAELAQ